MSLILVEDSGAKVKILKLNRVEKLNALSRALLAEFIEALNKLGEKATAGELSALVIASSSEKAFCVGADLTERKIMSESDVSGVLNQLRTLMDNVASFPVPVIAALQGAAFGGGLELALACDLRIASATATMGLVETRLGIIPGAGGTQRLSRLVGPAKAKELIFTGKKITGSEAHCLGMVNAQSENPLRLASEWASLIAEGGPLALRAAKEAIDRGLDLEMSQALDLERASYEKILGTQDRFEGLAAFAEKRKPVFKGK